MQQIFRQTPCFPAKNKAIVRLENPVGIGPIGFSGEINKARRGQRLIELVEVCVSRELHFRPVVETCASQRAVVHAKAGDAYDVQWNVGSGAKARDVAGVGWYLWFDKSDGQHEESICLMRLMGRM